MADLETGQRELDVRALVMSGEWGGAGAWWVPGLVRVAGSALGTGAGQWAAAVGGTGARRPDRDRS